MLSGLSRTCVRYKYLNFRSEISFVVADTMCKILVVAFLCALCLSETLGLSEEMQALIDNLHSTCTAETGATDDMIERARKGDFAEDQSFKCYLMCIFDQMGCMTDDGKVDIEAVIAVLPPEVQERSSSVVRKCTEVGGSACETAWLTHKCFQKGAPDDYFVP